MDFEPLNLNGGDQNGCGARGILNFDFASRWLVVTSCCWLVVYILMLFQKRSRRHQNSFVLIGRLLKTHFAPPNARQLHIDRSTGMVDAMVRTSNATMALILTLLLVASTSAAKPAERLLQNLPVGVVLKSSDDASPDQTASVAQRLGGRIERITNSQVQVHGRAIQVNIVTAADDESAKAIYATLAKTKPFPYCFLRQHTVIEFVGDDVDEALATKSSYELGLIEKPDHVRYHVIAQIAAVEKANYMGCNPLFQLFVALDNGGKVGATQINQLSKQFAFGQSVTLRNPRLDGAAATYSFAPPLSHEVDHGTTITYSFEQFPEREGVPYVTASMDITVTSKGFLADTENPARSLTLATPQWPVDDPRVKALARQITEGKQSNEAKAMAILRWLAPGTNVRFEGQTGSRWGTIKVLEQRFGQCWDFSDCFVTLARAADVPCRQVAGWLYGSSGHVWAEFYREGKGWEQVDPTGGGALPCGIYHIPYFATDDGDMPILYVSMPIIKTVE